MANVFRRNYTFFDEERRVTQTSADPKGDDYYNPDTAPLLYADADNLHEDPYDELQNVDWIEQPDTVAQLRRDIMDPRLRQALSQTASGPGKVRTDERETNLRMPSNVLDAMRVTAANLWASSDYVRAIPDQFRAVFLSRREVQQLQQLLCPLMYEVCSGTKAHCTESVLVLELRNIGCAIVERATRIYNERASDALDVDDPLYPFAREHEHFTGTSWMRYLKVSIPTLAVSGTTAKETSYFVAIHAHLIEEAENEDDNVLCVRSFYFCR